MTKRMRVVLLFCAAATAVAAAFAVVNAASGQTLETAGDPCAIWKDKEESDVSTYTIGEKQEAVALSGYPEGTMARKYVDSVKGEAVFARDGYQTPEEMKAADLYYQEKGEMGCLTDDELDMNLGAVITYPATPPPGGVPAPEGVKTSTPEGSRDYVQGPGMVDD